MYIYPTALLISTLLAAHGFRKGSLSRSGAMTAFFVGYAHLANDLKVFGVGLIMFYLVGSRATKVGHALKAKLEEGHTKIGGNRDAMQVLCASLPSLTAALLYRVLFTTHSKSIIQSLFGVSSWPAYPTETACGLLPGLPKALIYAALGHYACSLSDTLSSELGILSPHPPILLTTLRPVPPGTNGGVSPLGLLVSLLGGAGMGAVVALDLGVENWGGCVGEGMGMWAGGEGGKMVLWGMGAGLGGSLLDSLLGATLQTTLYNPLTRQILTSPPPPPTRDKKSPPNVLQRISGPRVDGGWSLSNAQVNLVSSAVTAGVMGWVGWSR